MNLKHQFGPHLRRGQIARRPHHRQLDQIGGGALHRRIERRALAEAADGGPFDGRALPLRPVGFAGAAIDGQDPDDDRFRFSLRVFPFQRLVRRPVMGADDLLEFQEERIGGGGDVDGRLLEEAVRPGPAVEVFHQSVDFGAIQWKSSILGDLQT
ncbi:hypothetical protein SDC9_133655 [bioreactor metagenome]|uniref:Uncharacterized protein n=1 Tax=bioreactor metagenome TaxID=1076179 RepID=A0A645DAW4_9ZZZZ